MIAAQVLAALRSAEWGGQAHEPTPEGVENALEDLACEVWPVCPVCEAPGPTVGLELLEAYGYESPRPGVHDDECALALAINNLEAAVSDDLPVALRQTAELTSAAIALLNARATRHGAAPINSYDDLVRASSPEVAREHWAAALADAHAAIAAHRGRGRLLASEVRS